MTHTTAEKKLFAKPLVGLCFLRSLHYFLEYQIMQTLSAIYTRSPRISARFTPESWSLLATELRELFETDVHHVLNSRLPARILWTESPLSHLKRVPKIVFDGIRLSKRRKKRHSRDFTEDAHLRLEGLPDYYRCNFHFQTDGYLSEHSAELYDHQVELLFAGAADAMRRIVLPDVVRLFAGQAAGDAAASSPATVLELGCGTGSMTKNVRLAFSSAEIVATDLSEPYLKKARRRLKGVQFVEADAAKLPFKDEAYDLVYSVFMFHELPREVRNPVIQEVKRVLKPGGIFFYVDSLQLDDRPNFNHILRNFPRDFHEPFYLNYIESPMRDLIEPAGFRTLTTRFGFLAKGEVFQKI